ncbi:MAG: hypothetical protein WBQ75_14795, partial [Acetobacteraceae bacterium]
VAQLDGGLVNHAPNLVHTSAAPESPSAQNHTAIRLFINRPLGLHITSYRQPMMTSGAWLDPRRQVAVQPRHF